MALRGSGHDGWLLVGYPVCVGDGEAGGWTGKTKGEFSLSAGCGDFKVDCLSSPKYHARMKRLDFAARRASTQEWMLVFPASAVRTVPPGGSGPRHDARLAAARKSG